MDVHIYKSLFSSLEFLKLRVWFFAKKPPRFQVFYKKTTMKGEEGEMEISHLAIGNNFNTTTQIPNSLLA